MMYFNWVSTTREERLRSNLLEVQKSFEALQHSSQRDLKEFEELCLQQFEAEMSQTKEAEHSRRLDLVEERDELRREVSALQSRLARTVAEKVRFVLNLLFRCIFIELPFLPTTRSRYTQAGIEGHVREAQHATALHAARLLHTAARSSITSSQLRVMTHLQSMPTAISHDAAAVVVALQQ